MHYIRRQGRPTHQAGSLSPIGPIIHRRNKVEEHNIYRQSTFFKHHYYIHFKVHKCTTVSTNYALCYNGLTFIAISLVPDVRISVV